MQEYQRLALAAYDIVQPQAVDFGKFAAEAFR